MKTTFPICVCGAHHVKVEEKTMHKTHSYATQETDLIVCLKI